jgi:hypothetical protein
MESKRGPLGMHATSGLLYLLRVIVRMENLVELLSRGLSHVSLLGNSVQLPVIIHNCRLIYIYSNIDIKLYSDFGYTGL